MAEQAKRPKARWIYAALTHTVSTRLNHLRTGFDLRIKQLGSKLRDKAHLWPWELYAFRICMESEQ